MFYSILPSPRPHTSYGPASSQRLSYDQPTAITKDPSRVGSRAEVEVPVIGVCRQRKASLDPVRVSSSDRSRRHALVGGAKRSSTKTRAHWVWATHFCTGVW